MSEPESIGELIRRSTTDGILARARNQIGKEQDPATWADTIHRLDPYTSQVDLVPTDAIWNADQLGAMLDVVARCANCDMERWLFHKVRSATQKDRTPCQKPMVFAVTRTDPVPKNAPIGRLKLSWMVCSTYRNWALEMKEKYPDTTSRRGRSNR